jgi:small nuclear ribonucleoprotein (snRNP)-like protein
LRDGRKLIGVLRSYDQYGEALVLYLMHESAV